MSSRYWCETAWLGHGPDAHCGVLLEVDRVTGRFVDVTADVPEGSTADCVQLDGLTLPGLSNAHSHAFHRALRGRTHEAGSFWAWRDLMYEVAARLDPDSYLELAKAVFAEMALSGITTVGEFHYLHHDPFGRPYTGDPMGEAVIEAAEAAGIRLTLIDACYLTGGIGADPDPVQRRFSDGTADRWVARVDKLADCDMVRIGAAIHSVRAVPPEAMNVVAAWAEGRGAPLHAHVSEQPAENLACTEAYGLTPTGLLASVGVLGPRFTAVHATHVSPADIDLLGSSGSAVCMCPTTERELADGVGPASRLRSARTRLCLGTDSQAAINLFEEARAVELDERLVTGRRGLHPPAALLTDATVGGASALGWPEAGRLAAGAPADFVTLRIDSPAMVNLLDRKWEGAAAAAVFCAGPADVTDVFVGGRQIVSEGRHLHVDDVGAALRMALWKLREP